MRSLTVAVALAVGFAAAPVVAWWDGGHKIVASIAFRRLTGSEQEKIVAILRQHPRFRVDFLDAAPAEAVLDADQMREWCFQQAAIWPDLARKFRGSDLETYHHGPWHYISMPHFMNDADRAALHDQLKLNVSLDAPASPEAEMNAIQTIRAARRILNDRQATDLDKALMIVWLFHVVGDIHQPMHSTTLFSSRLFREGDHGGNDVPTVQRKNLHSVWDSFPGGTVDLKTARDDALRLMSNAELKQLGEKSAGELDEKLWLDESRQLATTVVYDDEILTPLRGYERQGGEVKPIELSEDYLRRGSRIADRRVVQAGYRLGAILKAIAE
jgi:hypothetical protein